MKKIRQVILYIFWVLAFHANAQVVPLDSILSQIEFRNPMLAMYNSQIEAVNTSANGAKSWMPPTFSSGPWQVPYSNFNEGMWMITGEQMIPNPARQRANFNYMLGMVEVEKQRREAKRNELFYTAKISYFSWAVAQKKLEQLVQTDSILNYILKVAQLRYTLNKEKVYSIYKTRAELFELRNMQSMLLGEMKMRKAELNSLMNRDQTFVFEVDTAFVIHDYEISELDSSKIIDSRSDLKQYEASKNLLLLQQQYEKTKRLPDFGLSLSHMQSLNRMPNQYSAMGMISLPIAPWSSKEYKSTIRALDHSIESVNLQKQAMLNETMAMLVSIQVQIKSTKEQLLNFSENILPAYLNNCKASILAYDQNTEDLFVVLDAIKMYRMSKMSELDQWNSLLKLQVEYEKELQIDY